MARLFGTDGIRGKANEYPITPEIALKVGKAVAQIYAKSNGTASKASKPFSTAPTEPPTISLR